MTRHIWRAVTRTGAAIALVAGLLVMDASAVRANNGNLLWYFLRNYSDQTNSILQLRDATNYYNQKVLWTFRAGSGMTQNECQVNYGWIPDGSIAITGWSWNWPGTTVQGPVLVLADKQCYNGTWRTQLFVHSSYPWSTSRYYSNGCVKLSNTGGPSPASGDIHDAIWLNGWYGYSNWLISV